MKDVVDPELGINVVDLGLVYGIHVDEDNVATLDMTLTSAACPLTDVIEDQTRAGAVQRPRRRPGQRHPDQLGVDAAVGPGQDHRRGSRAAARARLQRLTGFDLALADVVRDALEAADSVLDHGRIGCLRDPETERLRHHGRPFRRDEFRASRNSLLNRSQAASLVSKTRQ